MSIWLPDLLYKLTCLSLVRATSLLQSLPDNLRVMIFSLHLIDYSVWIMTMQLKWNKAAKAEGGLLSIYALYLRTARSYRIVFQQDHLLC